MGRISKDLGRGGWGGEEVGGWVGLVGWGVTLISLWLQ